MEKPAHFRVEINNLEDRNVLFMDDGGPAYLGKLLTKALA